MRKSFGAPLAAVLVVGVAFVAPASAATLADWEMNEGPGAHTMIDSGPNHYNGTIGSGLQTGVSVMGATGYRWAFVSPTAPPAKPERLVQVANHSSLNPGTGNYTVTIRYRTTQHFGNMVQKGQAGSSGYWKIENPNGRIKCLMKGSSKTCLGSVAGGAQRRQLAHRGVRTHVEQADAQRRRPGREDRVGQPRHDLQLASDHRRRQAQLRPDHHDV